jgi:hypothetical protein
VSMPLSDLDAVDWSSLSHAYGPAKTTADELRALTSDDEEMRSEALAALISSICHQGSVYPASGAAVPFLMEIAAMERLPADFRAEVVMLVNWIAEGNVHLERDAPDLAQEPWGRTLSSNLRQATPQLLHLVRRGDAARIRAWAVWTVRTLPATPEDLDELRAVMAVERDSTVRATIVLALDRDDAFLRSLISPIEDPLVRFCAAAQMIPITTDLESLLSVAQESAPLSRRFTELPIVQEDTDPIRLIASRLGIVSQDEQVKWIGNWLHDRAWSVPALYSAAGAGQMRRSTARLLIEPVAEVVKDPPGNDPEIQATATFALLELGLPGLVRLSELAPSLPVSAQELINHQRAGTESQAAVYATINLNRPVSVSKRPLDLAATITAASLGTVWEWDGISALDDLAAWGTQAIDQTSVVEQLLDHPRSPLLRIHSAWALARITNESARSVTVLIKEFQPGLIGFHVVQILGALGREASAALPILKAYVTRDLRPPDVSALKDDLVAKACVEAIARIEAMP